MALGLYGFQDFILMPNSEYMSLAWSLTLLTFAPALSLKFDSSAFSKFLLDKVPKSRNLAPSNLPVPGSLAFLHLLLENLGLQDISLLGSLCSFITGILLLHMRVMVP